MYQNEENQDFWRGGPLLWGYVKTSNGCPIDHASFDLCDDEGNCSHPHTDADGFYSRRLEYGKEYTISIDKVGGEYTFDPGGEVDVGLNDPQVDDLRMDFLCTSVPDEVYISGYVLTEDGTGVGGVEMIFSNGESATTSSSGYYSEYYVETSTSEETVTPSHLNYTFVPPSRSYPYGFCCSLRDQDFIAKLKVIYVDVAAMGDNDGSSWANAFNCLQDALAVAVSGDTIRVAEEIYRPDEGIDQVPGDREATFKLINGVAIYGGFPSGGGAWGDRDPSVYETILSGDLLGDDNPTTPVEDLFDDPTRGENSYTVVTCSETDLPTILDGFTITGGNADVYGGNPDHWKWGGGGMYNDTEAEPTVTNCTFSGNVARRGGGMYNDNGSPTVTDCTFSGNSADLRGGGMYNDNGSPTLTKCTFSGNHAGDGGGMYNEGSDPTLRNCTFSGNDIRMDGGGMLNYDSDPTVSGCTFSGNEAGWSGGGMNNTFSSSPTLTNCTFSGNSASGSGGGMRNYYNSNPTVTNCILWGNTASSEGNEIYNYDTTNIPVISYCDIADSGGSGGGWDISLGTDSGGNIDADPLFISVPDDLRLQAGSPCIDAGDNTAVTEANDLDGLPRIIDGDNDGISTVDMGAYEWCPPIYVDETASGSNNGSSWADAFNCLQDALDEASQGYRIWVAAGTYYPDTTGLADPREASFQMINGVAIYGGFAGTEDTLAQRDVQSSVTILSGDIGTVSEDSNNCYHVFYHPEGLDLDSTAVLDGFTISSGNANGSWPNHVGAGMFNDSGSPTVTNCTFSGNSANSAGGGMYNYDHSNPTVINCTFSGNSADSSGGGMFNIESSPMVTNCTFSGNSADFGGGMLSDNSSPMVTNCTFSGNSAGWSGGGMYNYYTDTVKVTNCTFSGNAAQDYDGGGIYNGGSSTLIVSNCILWGNTDDGPQDESAQIFNKATATSVVNYSCVQGWMGTGNTDADPCFVDADGDEDTLGTADDNLRLQADSDCIDAGDNTAVPLDANDLDGDGDTTEPIPFDLDGNRRIVDADNDGISTVDMGAYESIWDSDGDGIEEPIDEAPTVDSNDFSDAATTYGTITSRGDQILFITDEPDPCGVRIKASPSGGAMPATVTFCGGGDIEDIVTLSAGDEAFVNGCSFEIKVISGIIEIAFVPVAGPAMTTSLAAGNSLTFEAATFTITAPLANPNVVVLLFQGAELYLTPGETLIFNQPPVADAGDDQTAEQESYAGTEVTLDGSGSTDPDSTPGTNDDIVAFDWYEGVTLLGSGEITTYTFPLGSHTVTLVVTDSFGETDSDEAIIVVQDTTPPEISCPADVSVEQESYAGTVVALEATATDDCDPNPAITSDELAIYPLGVTTVTFTATDASGNSAICSTTVTVVDTTPPEITCPANVTVEQESYAGTVVALEATATDN